MKSAANIRGILDELAETAKWVLDGSQALMAHGQFDPFPSWALRCPNLLFAVNEIALSKDGTANNLMINLLKPGVIVPIHTDNVPKRPKRWHLPLITNTKSWWWDAGTNQKEYMEVGTWYGPLPYWLNHQVGNEGDTDRIHLVVDLT